MKQNQTEPRQEMDITTIPAGEFTLLNTERNKHSRTEQHQPMHTTDIHTSHSKHILFQGETFSKIEDSQIVKPILIYLTD